MSSQPKLDTERPYGIYNEIRDGIPGRFYGQDGALFNIQTGEFARYLDDAPSPPAPKEDAEPVADVETIVCKDCGKTYKVGKTPQSRALAVSNMKKHLQKVHGIALTDGASK